VRRGEIWRYEPVVRRGDAPALRLIVSADGINLAEPADAPVVFGVHLLPSDPGKLLAIRIEPHGWASVMTLERVLRRRLVERLGSAPDDVLEQVDASLRAVLEL